MELGKYPSGTKPIMSDADRQKTKKILDDRFNKVNMRFLSHTVSLKSRMHRLLMRARTSIAARNNGEVSSSSGGEEGGGRGGRRKMKPRISFVQFSEQLDEQQIRSDKIQGGIKLIEQRMENLNLKQIVMKDDGNCQFRSIAHQLFGDADKYHKLTRSSAVDYLTKNKDSYSFYFDGDREWERYLKTMSKNGTWGDELTLRAVSNTFRCTIHVVTSEKEHYYISYAPDEEDAAKGRSNDDDDATAAECEDIFLAYISPIHYNSIHLVEK